MKHTTVSKFDFSQSIGTLPESYIPHLQVWKLQNAVFYTTNQLLDINMAKNFVSEMCQSAKTNVIKTINLFFSKTCGYFVSNCLYVFYLVTS